MDGSQWHHADSVPAGRFISVIPLQTARTLAGMTMLYQWLTFGCRHLPTATIRNTAIGYNLYVYLANFLSVTGLGARSDRVVRTEFVTNRKFKHIRPSDLPWISAAIAAKVRRVTPWTQPHPGGRFPP